jgi:adenosylmethionine-8-amino-7-oxononanoate aminotransferase
VEFVEDRGTKSNFAADRKIAARCRIAALSHGCARRSARIRCDAAFFASPLIVSESEVDRLVGVAREAARAVLGT